MTSVTKTELSWVAKVSGRFKVAPRDGFADMSELRVLAANKSITFSPGESFGVRGVSEEVGNGLHIIQAVGETTIEGPAVLERSDWGLNKVDRMVASERSNRPVIIAVCGCVIALSLLFYRNLGPALPAFIILPILMGRIMWPKLDPKEFDELLIRRAPPDL